MHVYFPERLLLTGTEKIRPTGTFIQRLLFWTACSTTAVNSWLIKYIVFYAVSAIFRPYNGGSSEQYMMHQKAVLFQDTKQARDILNFSDPLLMKWEGRQNQHFDKNIWQNCKDIVQNSIKAILTKSKLKTNFNRYFSWNPVGSNRLS